MNFLNKCMGKATEMEAEDAASTLGEGGMINGEEILHAFQIAARDLLIITSKRLIRVEKRTVASQPWKNVTSWSYKEAGALDADSELYLHLVNEEEPLTIELARSINVAAVSASIGAAITGSC